MQGCVPTCKILRGSILSDGVLSNGILASQQGHDAYTDILALNPIVSSRAQETDRPVQQGYVAELDGVDDYVSIGDVTTFNHIHQTGVFSLGMWFCLADYTADRMSVFFGNNGISSGYTGVSLFYDNRAVTGHPKNIRFQLSKGVGGQFNSTFATANNIITDNIWHHVCVVGDGSGVTLYLDNVVVGNQSYTNLPFSAASASYPMNLARGGNSNFTGECLIGSCVFHNVALSNGQRDALYAGESLALQGVYNLNHKGGTVAFDSSGNGNHGTLMNGAAFVADNTIPTTMDKNNLGGFTRGDILRNDKLVKGSPESDDGTIFVNVRNPDFSSLNTYLCPIFSGRSGTSNGAIADASLSLYENPSNPGQFRVLGRYGSYPYEYSSSFTTKPVDGVYNIALTLDSTTHEINVFVNGVKYTTSGSRASGSPKKVAMNLLGYIYTNGSHSGYGKFESYGAGYSPEIMSDEDLIAITSTGDASSMPYYYEPDGLIPRDESTPTKDVLGNDLQYSGSVFPVPPVKRGSYCGVFDGVDDYVTTPIIPTSSGSIEVKFRKGSGINRFLMGARDSTNTRCVVGYDSSRIAHGGIGSDSGAVINSGQVLTTGEIYTLKLAWTGSTVSLSVNGVVMYSGAQSGSVGVVQPYYIGTFNDAGSPFSNYCDDELIHVKVNDQLIYVFSEGRGDTIYDVSGNSNHGTVNNASTATEGVGFWAGRQDEMHWNHDNGFTHGLNGRIPALADGSGNAANGSGALTNPAVPYGSNGAETTLDVYNIAEGDNPCPESSGHGNFDAIEFGDDAATLAATSPANTVFRRDKSAVAKDRLVTFSATLTGDDLTLLENYTT